MKRLHEGLDYKLYQIYIWGGLAAIVIYCLSLSFFIEYNQSIQVSDKTMLLLFSAPVTIWFLGVLAYWWWAFLFKDKPETEAALSKHYDSAPPISDLKSWSTLHTAMSLYGGNVETLRKDERAATIPILIFYGMQNLMAFCVFSGFYGYVFFNDISPIDLRAVTAIGVVTLAVTLLVVTPLLIGRGARAGEAAYLAPLGLAMEESPSGPHYQAGLENIARALSGDGVSTFGGRRLSRQVRIQAAGKTSLTWIGAETVPFEINNQDGKLTASPDEPEFLKKALKGFRKAKRWRGAFAGGGPQGLWVERKSTGMNMWLYDLWLLERIIEYAEA
ncbi:hypothetical protein ACFLZW_02040 [Chloroflexota bacterium]